MSDDRTTALQPAWATECDLVSLSLQKKKKRKGRKKEVVLLKIKLSLNIVYQLVSAKLDTFGTHFSPVTFLFPEHSVESRCSKRASKEDSSSLPFSNGLQAGACEPLNSTLATSPLMSRM